MEKETNLKNTWILFSIHVEQVFFSNDLGSEPVWKVVLKNEPRS